jgi:hypothetical protein
MLPAMQKGEDGRWQPPSLSRGSMSTSALALYKEELNDRPSSPSPDDQETKGKKKTHKHTLSGLFHSNRFTSKAAIPPPIEIRQVDPRTLRQTEKAIRVTQIVRTQHSSEKVKPDLSQNVAVSRNNGKGRTQQPSAMSATSWQEVSPPGSPRTPRTPRTPTPRSPTTPTFLQVSPGKGSLDVQHDVPRQRAPIAPAARSSSLAHSVARPSQPVSSNSEPTLNTLAMPPPPIRPRAHSVDPPMLSRDHFLLRLSTSYIVKCLTPVIRGSGFVQNERNFEMKRLADDRLTSLSRMERAWGGEWARVAGTLGSDEQEAGVETPAAGSVEARVRAVNVGERAKERERKAWVEAMKDGILLCL